MRISKEKKYCTRKYLINNFLIKKCYEKKSFVYVEEQTL